MRNYVPIVAVVAIVAIVGVFGYTTFNNQTVGQNETVNLLNASGDMISVTNIAELTLILKQPDQYINNTTITKTYNKSQSNPQVISQDEMKKAYEDIFSEFGIGNAKILISVSDLYKTTNGIEFYVVEVTVETDNYVSIFIFYQDAYTKPTLTDDGIDGVYLQRFLESPKNQDNLEQPKYSEDQILEMAKTEYANHKQNATGDEKYDIDLTYVGKDPVYTVLINNEDILEYDGNTGELISSTLTDEETVDYASIAREVAQDRLKQENSPYSENLSLGSVSNTTDGDKILFTFEIIFTDEHGKQSVGHITVDAKSRQVTDFVLNDPEIIEDAEEPVEEIEEQPTVHEEQKTTTTHNKTSHTQQTKNTQEPKDDVVVEDGDY